MCSVYIKYLPEVVRMEHRTGSSYTISAAVMHSSRSSEQHRQQQGSRAAASLLCSVAVVACMAFNSSTLGVT
jgi:hypothetical protein